MIAIGLILVSLAALIHVYIFYLEAFAWTTERGRRTFGLTPDEASATKELAFNQGFYNLFLAVIVLTGVGLVAGGLQTIGIALALAGAGSMVAAAAVLVLSSPSKAGAAMIQGVTPLLGVIQLVIVLAI
ncbi:DUF1304 domain-containing protein [Rarobacter faecitabidus]|uniref:Putative membrane protein n=1 Tax=Rarobacter faecitabidus TaxID=13243 RepID=A0A542ZVM2_RARFA|nr:DUF1304 domain-containing protein [Rarobacter faecitabidus]TQL64371.1 putative membrane protein [Rarobacter faecitabidus]